VSNYHGKTEPTARMKRFAELYDGDGTAAALAAGYSVACARQAASNLLDDPRIAALIDAREKKSMSPLIRSRVRRQEWLVKVVENAGAEMKDRLKAMELLKRSCGDFIEHVSVQHSGTVAVLPLDLDTETLRFIARGGLRETVVAPALPAGEPDDAETTH
jgi:phage terminase small subunit